MHTVRFTRLQLIERDSAPVFDICDMHICVDLVHSIRIHQSCGMVAMLFPRTEVPRNPGYLYPSMAFRCY